MFCSIFSFGRFLIFCAVCLFHFGTHSLQTIFAFQPHHPLLSTLFFTFSMFSHRLSHCNTLFLVFPPNSKWHNIKTRREHTILRKTKYIHLSLMTIESITLY